MAGNFSPKDLVRFGVLPLTTVLLVAGVASAEPLLRGAGLAFPTDFPDLGESLELVGHLDIDNSEPPFPALPGSHEYTWTLYGSVVHHVEEPAAGIRYLHLTFGVIEIREDSVFNSAFLADPPNVLVPSSFHDGEVVLLGAVTNLRIRQIFGIFTASGDVHFETGKAVADLGGRNWSLNAAISEQGEIPSGYGTHWNLELSPRKPIHIKIETWTNIKALYR